MYARPEAPALASLALRRLLLTTENVRPLEAVFAMVVAPSSPSKGSIAKTVALPLPEEADAAAPAITPSIKVILLSRLAAP